MTRPDVDKALDRLRAASLDASKGTAYICGPPWFRNGSGVLVGSPDPHAGQMIADTDTSLLDPDNHAEIDDDCNAIFLAEAWNFARMLLGSPALLDAIRSTGTGRSEAEASVGGMRAADYESIGTTYDGVRVLAPKTKSTNFTTEEIREAVKKAIAEDAGRTALNLAAREGEGDQP